MYLAIRKGLSLCWGDSPFSVLVQEEKMMESKVLKEGVTTGTCAAACAYASAIWQISGRLPAEVIVDTPAGRAVRMDIIAEKYPKCSVIKDAGDDPDVTDGCMVSAVTSIGDEDGELLFVGGEGVGTVTAPGLKVAVGEPAINPVPRQMIEQHVRKVIGSRQATVTISIKDGETLAKRTFNPRLGIVGGLSILGTTGIVRPMSEEAVKASLSAELSVRLAVTEHIVFVPGNSAEAAMAQKYGAMSFVQISNYVGYMLDEAWHMGAKTILIAGFAGKLVKVAADIMNTHSHVADGRRETVCTFAALNGADQKMIETLYKCKTIQKTIEVIKAAGLECIWTQIAQTAAEKCRLRTGGEIKIGVLLLDKDGNEIGASKNISEILAYVMKGDSL